MNLAVDLLFNKDYLLYMTSLEVQPFFNSLNDKTWWYFWDESSSLQKF